jgi:hypothetical protein
MTTQVINAFFHVFFSFYFNDFSPGAITAVLLYLPVNYFIIRAALREGYIKSYVELLILFLSGIATFTLFEMMGPQVLGYALILMPIYYITINNLEKRNESVI